MTIYTPLATKYRPQNFIDVIGQDITIKIITNGIQTNRLGAAMLFSGTHGVGKTTIARILAKTFRCENRQEHEIEPCGKCESCLTFLQANQIDVIEIDAASNTSVDDMREVIESCRYKPSSGKFKIFIIDEVHMLSKSAFNALLKTLEEPPEHVKFFLATTETYKIPDTILSRVLKFDLKNVNEKLIMQHLSSVCNKENISANSQILSLIAKSANGSIRDSLSILDQVINLSESNTININDVTNLLQISDENDFIELLQVICSADLKNSIKKYRTIINSGISCNAVVNKLMDYVHVLSCIKTDIPQIEQIVSNETSLKLQQISDSISLPALSQIWQMLIKGANELNISEHPEIVLEMMLIRVVYATGLPDLQQIIQKINQDSSKINQKINEDCGIKKTSYGNDAKTDSDNAKISINDILEVFPSAK